MVRLINLRLDGHVDLKATIDQINAQRQREAEREVEERVASGDEHINLEHIQLPPVEHGYDVDITENSDEAEGCSFKVKFKGILYFPVQPIVLLLLQHTIILIISYQLKGKNVEPLKISCGKLRLVMQNIEFLIDEMFKKVPPYVEERPELTVSNAELPAFMKKVFGSFNECISLMNFEGLFVYILNDSQSSRLSTLYIKIGNFDKERLQILQLTLDEFCETYSNFFGSKKVTNYIHILCGGIELFVRNNNIHFA